VEDEEEKKDTIAPPEVVKPKPQVLVSQSEVVKPIPKSQTQI